MAEELTGRVEYFRQQGHWHLVLHAQEWVIADIKRDLETKGNVFTVGNYGGGTMLLVGASWDVRNPKADGEHKPAAEGEKDG